jgi:hypothetical protein
VILPRSLFVCLWRVKNLNLRWRIGSNCPRGLGPECKEPFGSYSADVGGGSANNAASLPDGGETPLLQSSELGRRDVQAGAEPVNQQWHDEFVALCALFPSGELSEEEWVLLQVHLAYCDPCRAVSCAITFSE